MAGGLNRVSVGVQSFDDAVLRRMGRPHDARQAVDAIEDPASVAIVIRPVLRDQRPAVMADTLALLGATAQREVVGEYEIFHHVGMPDARVHPVPTTGWRARGSADASGRSFALDQSATRQLGATSSRVAHQRAWAARGMTNRQKTRRSTRNRRIITPKVPLRAGCIKRFRCRGA